MSTFTCSSEWIKNEEELQEYVDKNVDECFVVNQESIVKLIVTELARTGRPSSLLTTDTVYIRPANAEGFFHKINNVLYEFVGMRNHRDRDWLFFSESTVRYVDYANAYKVLSQIKL